MAVAIRQSKEARGVSGNTTVTLDLALLTGTTVVIGFVLQTSDNMAFSSVTDANNTYAARAQRQGGTGTNWDLQIWDKRVITGGATQISINVGAFAGSFDVVVLELTGVHASDAIPTDFTDEGASTSHTFAAGLTGTGLIFGCAEFGASVTATMAGWTIHDPSSPPNGVLIVSKIGTFSAETAPYTINTSTNASHVAALYPEAAAVAPTLAWQPRTHVVRRPRIVVVASGMTPPERPE